MPTWNPSQYLKFDDERTRPCRDLVARIRLENPKRIIDLGCGPGNSTQVLVENWPAAEITGLDSSEQMIRSASEKYTGQKWEIGNIHEWSAKQPYDLVFSNAAYQWVPDHAQVMPHLMQQLAPGGVFAFQVPANINAPAHELMRGVTSSAAWKSRFPEKIREWYAHGLSFYMIRSSIKPATSTYGQPNTSMSWKVRRPLSSGTRAPACAPSLITCPTKPTNRRFSPIT